MDAETATLSEEVDPVGRLAIEPGDREGHIAGAVRATMSARDRVNVSEWIERNRVLDPNYASEPGPFRLDRTPYMSEPYNCFIDPEVSRITLVKSARIGGSEWMNNLCLYSMDRVPGPSMYVLPTEDDAKDEATGRLRFMIEDCPPVAAYIPYPGWATAEQLTLSGPRSMYMAWAQAPRTLIRKTCRYVFFDELDNLERAAGMLGNHLAVAAERTTTYGRLGKVASSTTPTHPDAAAWREWKDSDQRRYYVPCRHCGTYQVLTFDRIKWPQEVDADAIEADALAWYDCIECDEPIRERDRWWMVQRGVWLTRTEKPVERLPLKKRHVIRRAASLAANRWRPRTEGEPVRTRRRGYHIWSAYSPWRTFSMIAAEFLRCKDHPDKLRVFVNSWLGEPFTDVVSDVEIETLREKRKGALDKDVLHESVKIIVVGIDTQTDHFVYEVRGWGASRRSWLIREGTVETFEELEGICTMSFENAGRTGVLRPMYAAIDSGGDRTEEVYGWSRRFRGVYPVKGMQDAAWSVRPSRIDYTPTGKRTPWSLLLYLVNTRYYKDMLTRLITVEPGEPGSWSVHRQATEDYFRQITAEHLIWVTKGRREARRRQPVWALKSQNRPNHYLDAAVYGLAIADHLGITGLSDGDLRDRKGAEDSQKAKSKRSIRDRRRTTTR